MTAIKKSLDADRYDTDKKINAHYLRNYEEYFARLVDQEIRLLELGIYYGGSLLLWRDYFQKGIIVGLDINPVSLVRSSSLYAKLAADNLHPERKCR
ncbi:MAG: hypothetical protein ACR2G4_02910 [Pyrinomonadaceae bacterium]